MQRNEQDRAASEGGRLEESCEHAAVLGDVLEDVECANDVERARRRLERVHLDQLHAGQAISCMGEMLRRHVGAGQFQAGKRLPHCCEDETRPAPDIQQRPRSREVPP